MSLEKICSTAGLKSSFWYIHMTHCWCEAMGPWHSSIPLGQSSLRGPEPLAAPPVQKHLPRLILVLELCFLIPWHHKTVSSTLEKYSMRKPSVYQHCQIKSYPVNLMHMKKVLLPIFIHSTLCNLYHAATLVPGF